MSGFELRQMLCILEILPKSMSSTNVPRAEILSTHEVKKHMHLTYNFNYMCWANQQSHLGSAGCVRWPDCPCVSRSVSWKGAHPVQWVVLKLKNNCPSWTLTAKHLLCHGSQWKQRGLCHHWRTSQLGCVVEIQPVCLRWMKGGLEPHCLVLWGPI